MLVGAIWNDQLTYVKHINVCDIIVGIKAKIFFYDN